MEGLLLTLVCVSVWGFGAVHPGFELLLDVGIALLLFLWAARVLLCGRIIWQQCPVALCLSVLFITAVWQLVPWPAGWLSTLSPHTADLSQRLLPAHREGLPSGEAAPIGGPVAGSTISLCPGLTQRESLRLLAVLLLYALVRSNLTGAARLRRLSLVLLANGVLLSLFALVQFFTWGPRLLYGVYPTEGAAFGPFICRNHFPYYVNICLGLGLGLLLSSLVGKARGIRGSRPNSAPDMDEAASEAPVPRRSSSRRAWKVTTYAPPADDSTEGWAFSAITTLLKQPWGMGLLFAVILLATAVLFSGSRGGALALVGALLGCFLLHVRRSASFFKVCAVALLIALPVLALLSWFGLDRVHERWHKLFDETVASVDGLETGHPGASPLNEIDRLALWSANWPAVKDFPLWGTGYGTFELTELLHRHKVEQEGTLFEHAHNDYLEVLLEGGIAGLIPVLFLAGLLLWFGYRAVRGQRDDSAGWLATGVFFGLLTLVIHSFVDFGLHLPAIACLATVLCAHLAALGCPRERSPQEATAPQGNGGAAPAPVRPGGLAVCAAFTLAVFGVVLVQYGWKRHKASRLLDAAVRLVEGVDYPDRSLQIAYLQAAVAEQPGSPHLRLELARAQMALYLQEEEEEKGQATLRAVTQGVVTLAGGSLGPDGLSPALSGMAAAVAQEVAIRERGRPRCQRLLMPALGSYLATRDLCPILAEPHVRIAAHANSLIGAEEPSAYMERAKLLSPANPTIWYLCGKLQFRGGQLGPACQSWRHSLELSELYLPDIVKPARQVLSESELIEKLLPSKPRVLVSAAMDLHGSETEAELRRPYLEKALRLLSEQPEPLAAEDLVVRAIIYDSFGDKKEALASYQNAVGRAPQDISLRLSYARLLYEEGQPREAERHLQTILAQQPGHAEAKELLAEVRREILNKR